MSEQKIDNPAQRLLDILEEGRKKNGGAECRTVWSELLQTQGSNEPHLLSRLAKVMELPGRISQVRENHFSSQRGKSSHWRICIDHAFVSQSLNSNWSSFIGHIDERTLSELSLLSDLFETRGSHSVIEAGEIESLLERISELRNEIRASGLSFTMKTLLMKQLSQLQEALESYSISGVEPVMDAVQSTLGLAVMNPEYRNEIKKDAGSLFGEKISILLNDVANVVTVAGALPVLTLGVHTALAYLSQ